MFGDPIELSAEHGTGLDELYEGLKVVAPEDAFDDASKDTEAKLPKPLSIAITGRPNAGKSTLLNRLVGSKISIVSPKVQTTRNRVLGVVIDGDAQIVFIDTPGIFAPRRRLDRAMVKAAWHGVAEADLTLLLVDAQRRETDEDTRRIIEGLKDGKRQALLTLKRTLLGHPGQTPVQLELRGPDFRVQLKGEGLYVTPSDLLMTQLTRLFGRKVAELV